MLPEVAAPLAVGAEGALVLCFAAAAVLIVALAVLSAECACVFVLAAANLAWNWYPVEAVNPVKVLLVCHVPQAPVDPVLRLYCVVHPLGAAVELTVMLLAVGVPLTTRCEGAEVVCRAAAAVLIVALGVLSAECAWVLVLFAINLAWN